MMIQNWSQRVASYVDQVEQIATTIELILDQTRLDTTEANSSSVQQSTADLEQALLSLEQKVADREELLHAEDAPPGGSTLVEKLAASGTPEDIELSVQCQRVSGLIESTHHRAISMFVCQYHLANLGSELVRLISGADAPATYGPGSDAAQSPAGGLFNEAA